MVFTLETIDYYLFSGGYERLIKIEIYAKFGLSMHLRLVSKSSHHSHNHITWLENPGFKRCIKIHLPPLILNPNAPGPCQGRQHIALTAPSFKHALCRVSDYHLCWSRVFIVSMWWVLKGYSLPQFAPFRMYHLYQISNVSPNSPLHTLKVFVFVLNTGSMVYLFRLTSDLLNHVYQIHNESTPPQSNNNNNNKPGLLFILQWTHQQIWHTYMQHIGQSLNLISSGLGSENSSKALASDPIYHLLQISC